MAAGDGVLVALGESCLEYIAHTDGYPKPDTRNFSTHSHIGGGGKAANAAVAFNRLATGRGISTRLITRVGRDPAGRSVLDGLRAEGIELPLEHLGEAKAVGVVDEPQPKVGRRHEEHEEDEAGAHCRADAHDAHVSRAAAAAPQLHRGA